MHVGAVVDDEEGNEGEAEEHECGGTNGHHVDGNRAPGLRSAEIETRYKTTLPLRLK